MKNLFIFNRLSHSVTPYADWFNSDEVQIHLFNCDKVADQFPQMTSNFAYSHYDSDLLTYDALKLAQTHKPDAIITTSEFDVLRASQLRETLNVQGQKSENAKHFRDKVLMKQKVAEAGLGVPNFSGPDSTTQLMAFVEANGYPLIIKPRDGAGSISVYKVENEQQLTDFLEKNCIEGMDVEAFVEGSLHHVDGLMIDGELVLCWPSSYLSGNVLDFKTGDHSGSFALAANNPLHKRLTEYTKNVLEALDAPRVTAFHCEVFHTNDDQLLLCEIACRLGGALVVPALNAIYQCNSYKMWIQAQAGIPLADQSTQQAKQLAGQLLYTPKTGTFEGIKDIEKLDWIDELTINAKPGEVFNGGQSSVHSIVSVLVTGTTEEEVKAKLAKASDLLNELVMWRDLVE